MKALGLLFGLFLCTSTLAEYNGYHLSLEIKTKSGNTIEAYSYITVNGIDPDSLQNIQHIIRRIQQGLGNYNNPGHIKYASQRIKYEFTPNWAENGEKNRIFSLSHIDSIAISDIQSIQVKDIIDYTYLVGIWNELDVQDVRWIKKPPVQSYTFSGYLCSYQVFAHELSAKNKLIFEKLLNKQQEIDDYYRRVENYELDDGEELDEDLFDDQIGDLMSQLELSRVIVISECTC